MAPEDPRNRASLRVKFLIKNMFDNKSKNWEKTKSEDTQVKKKAEIANQVTKKPKKNAKWRWELATNTAVEAAEVATMIATKVETMTVATEAAVMESAEVERTLVHNAKSNT